MSLTSAAAATASRRSNDICQKLLYVWYYYYRCFGTVVSHCIERCGNSNNNNNNARQHSNIDNNNGFITITTQIHAQTQHSRFAFHAYEQSHLMWFTFVSHLICCLLFTYGSFSLWISDDRLFMHLVLIQSVTISACPMVLIMVHFWYRKRLVVAINALLRLMQCIEEFHAHYNIFQWTHVALVALKVMCFVYEIECTVEAMVEEFTERNTWYDIVLVGIQMYLVIGVWISVHMVSLLYICIDAMYGSLNHYMRHEFIPRLKEMQMFNLTAAAPSTVRPLRRELATFAELFMRVHHVGSELHYLWQIPVVTCILFTYCAMICIIYFLVWQYFAYEMVHTRFFPYIVKQGVDIVLLSLTAHRAIKRSQLITTMGLENIILVENAEWHRQMELFLYDISLHNFKLNILGLFDINNTLTLTFLSGILTSISIFIPFTIKSYRMQTFLENRN